MVPLVGTAGELLSTGIEDKISFMISFSDVDPWLSGISIILCAKVGIAISFTSSGRV